MMKPDQTPAVAICGYRHLADLFARQEVHHVVSIMSDAEWKSRPTPIFGNRKVLRLPFDDVGGYASDGLIAASRDHVRTLIDFARGVWGGVGVLACQCRAGVSRSSAAGMIAAAAVRPSNWHAVATRVAQARSFYTPNTRMLRYADELLGLSPGLVDLVRDLPLPNRMDDWEPVVIPLD